MQPIEDKYNVVENDLLLKYISGRATGEERIRVDHWIQEDAENEKFVLQLAGIYYAQRTKERIQNRDAHQPFYKVQKRIRQRILRVYFRRIAISAACILLFVSISFNYLFLNKTEVETQFVTVQTNAGMRTSLHLPDGTLVYLNSASKLVYPVPFDQKERKVLLEGEGYFEVISDPEHPFIVSVAKDKMRIKALGTRFNVNAYPDEQEIYTTLVNGSVVLQFTDASKKITEKQLDNHHEYAYNLISRNVVEKERELVPQQKATCNPVTQKIGIQEVNTENEYMWKEGKLIFKDTPMPEVLSKLSNFYNVKFEVKNPLINSYPFTGTFDNKQLFQVLDYLELISRIDYKVLQVTEDDSNGRKYTVVVLNK